MNRERAAIAQQPAPITARQVARQVFALCESIEDKPDSAPDRGAALERFTAGERFAAKTIRRGIGTWLTDEENIRKGAAIAQLAEPKAPTDDDDDPWLSGDDMMGAGA